MLFSDYDYLNVLKLEMIEGRFFSKDFTTDTSAYVLNEAAVKAMGLESPVGKWFDLNGKGRIVGIVKNFHFASLHREIQPHLDVYRYCDCLARVLLCYESLVGEFCIQNEHRLGNLYFGWTPCFVYRSMHSELSCNQSSYKQPGGCAEV